MIRRMKKNCVLWMFAMLPLALMNLYYWELYPKLSQKNISVNVIKEYTNRPDLQ